MPEIDHKNYPKKLRNKSLGELIFIINDCEKALKAMPDSPKSGYYQDELNYVQMELNRRGVSYIPTVSQIEWWIIDSVCEATDGCLVEPDGTCQHGCKSWLLELGYI